MKIPIKVLKELAQKYGYSHVVMFAAGSKNMQYIATYGRRIKDCDQAAQFGDLMKDVLGWPEKLHAAPSRVRRLQERIKELEAQLRAVQPVDPTNNSRSYLVVLKNYLATHLLRGTSTYACALQEARERAGGNNTEYLILEVLEDVAPEASH